LASELNFFFDTGNLDEPRLLCETVLKRTYIENGRNTKIELDSPFILSPQRRKGRELFKW